MNGTSRFRDMVSIGVIGHLFGGVLLLQLLFEVVGHVLVGCDGGLAFEDYFFKLFVFGVFGFGGECSQGFRVICHHVVDVFLIEVFAGEFVEFIQFFLVVGVGAGREGKAPGFCEGLHGRGHLGVLCDHLFGERLDCGIGGFLFCQLAECYLVLVGLRCHGEKLLVVSRLCFCFEGEERGGDAEHCAAHPLRGFFH